MPEKHKQIAVFFLKVRGQSWGHLVAKEQERHSHPRPPCQLRHVRFQEGLVGVVGACCPRSSLAHPSTLSAAFHRLTAFVLTCAALKRRIRVCHLDEIHCCGPGDNGNARLCVWQQAAESAVDVLDRHLWGGVKPCVVDDKDVDVVGSPELG
eukprot:CAMPEP_0175955472 /NCGR_PEP_ID=MMETSP0108-20121206/32521_1 /TAXON_ID=195067 ORGANISM="Goniomonas pacifica, Strain CCMP1869" /NCGR_SAMPLE_ID=MMETSP0108 /ASSEMBLY_ACC=CAM_ASM_000204 /LENGTH=151 /DNA_ID=CAMNT_0017282339 /DNA_START=379 /DNA_END=834 /DNA_ORIENTATION=+